MPRTRLRGGFADTSSEDKPDTWNRKEGVELRCSFSLGSRLDPCIWFCYCRLHSEVLHCGRNVLEHQLTLRSLIHQQILAARNSFKYRPSLWRPSRTNQDGMAHVASFTAVPCRRWKIPPTPQETRAGTVPQRQQSSRMMLSDSLQIFQSDSPVF